MTCLYLRSGDGEYESRSYDYMYSNSLVEYKTLMMTHNRCSKTTLTLTLLYLAVLSFAAEHASSFSPTLPSQSCRKNSRAGIEIAAPTKNTNKNIGRRCSGGAVDMVQKHVRIPEIGQRYSAANVALSLSGGAAAAAVGAEIGGGPLSAVLGGLNAFFLSYPLISAVTTCSVKGCLADFIAQKRNNADGDNNEASEKSSSSLQSSPTKPTKKPFSFRRNAAYILYGGGILGVFCNIMYNFVYPFLFGRLDGIVHLIAIVSFDNMITAPLLWLPPVYFVKAILYGNPLKSGFHKYINDIKLRGLLTKYWTVWWPAQIVNFSLVPAHLRILFMAGISFFWLIVLSCVSSNSTKS